MTLEMKEKEIAEINFLKGKEEGIKEGVQKGIKEEKFKRMIKQIELLKRFNVDKNQIIKEISIDYDINQNEVKKYL